MKKKYFYPALILAFLGFSAFVVLKYKGKMTSETVSFYPIKERVGAAAMLPEWASTKTSGEKLIRIVRENPNDLKSTLSLAGLYIQEGRITGDHAYYDAAAMKYVDDVLIRKPNYFEALVLKAVIQLSQHHFTDALETANLAKSTNPYNAFVYGILVDGNVEMGQYEAAVENSDKMMSIRPDIRSYSRVSYLREIYGDYPGAIEAMKMAVEAGAYGDEATAWTRVQLAHLYELTGDLKSAAMHYTITLRERPGYGYAIAGMGHLAMAENNYGEAIKLYQQASATMNDYGLQEQLAELYLLSGDKQKGAEAIDKIIADLTKMSADGEQVLNHHADRELAYVYLLKNDFDNAEKHARLEYSRRPDNIDVAEALGWVLYKKGDANAALPFMEKALRTGSKNPVLLCRAGLIYLKAGNAAKAKSLISEAVGKKPNIDPVLLSEATKALQGL